MTQRRGGQRLWALSAATALVATLLIGRLPTSSVPAMPTWKPSQPARVTSLTSGLAVPAKRDWGDDRRAAVGSLPRIHDGESWQRVRAVRPTRIHIPAIGVEAAVIELGLHADDTLEVPTEFDEAGWWTGGAEPGARGPAVVAGHVDSRAGPAVFYRLHQLEGGDLIEILNRDGDSVRFAVERIERHPKDAFPTAAVYDATPHPTLRVITCGGAFDRAARSYVDNVIVFATLVH